MNAAKPSIPKGDTNVWITASMVGVTLLMVLAVVGVILVNGLGYFWPHSLQRIELRDAPPLFVRILETETREQTDTSAKTERTSLLGMEVWPSRPVTGTYERVQVKIANRDLNGLDFRWIDRPQITATTDPEDVFVVERLEYGEFYGTLKALKVPLLEAAAPPATPEGLRSAILAVHDRLASKQGDRDEIGRLRAARVQHRGRHLPGHLRHRDDGAAHERSSSCPSASSPPSTCASTPSRALVRMVRIAVNNLAGVPSIVFGVFGLGFFVYFVGGGIDRLFFPERLPTPDLRHRRHPLGLPHAGPAHRAGGDRRHRGGLAAVPAVDARGLARLGATKWQTTHLARRAADAAMPGILTGIILAMARGAGEVAPLMMVGVVKLAPELPLDGDFPFLHLDRKFMHLGFHIYDVGFQSPTSRPPSPWCSSPRCC
jgi:ABC-type phosphate transport system auxiliary subunit